MAYFMIKVYAPNQTTENFNQAVTDNTNPHNGVIQLRNIMDSVLAGTLDAEVSVAVRSTDQTITPDTDGLSADYNLR